MIASTECSSIIIMIIAYPSGKQNDTNMAIVVGKMIIPNGFKVAGIEWHWLLRYIAQNNVSHVLPGGYI